MIRKRIFALTVVLTLLFSSVCFAYPNYFETVFNNDYDKLYQDVTLLSLNSTAMLVNRAVRYLDDDNMKLTPKIINARTYVTAETAETIFNAYSEENINSAFLDFRAENCNSEDNRLLLGGSNAQINGASQSKNEYLVYIDAKAYMPLRKLAELLGNTVYYDNDGYILIGKESSVNAVIEKDGCLAYGKEILSEFAPSSETGKAFYVSPNGKDRGASGTIDDPYKTIAKATNNASAGDTIYIREGTYNEVISPTNDGKPSKPITYKAYNGEKVVISPTKEITGFTPTEENANIVAADCDVDLGRGKNQVFYNGKALVEARFPNVSSTEYSNSEVSNLFPTKGDLKLDYTDAETDSSGNKTSYKVTSSLLQNDADNKWQGATFVSLHGFSWRWGTAIVESSTAGSLTLDKESINGEWYTNREEVANCGYLTGHKNAIDLPGEWNITDGKLYIYLPDGETADSLKLQIKTGQLCADLREKSYIQLDGLEFVGGSITMDNSKMCVIKNCKMKNITHFDYTAEKSSEIPTVGASEAGEKGIYVGGENDVIRNCTIDESAGSGLTLTGIYTLVKNNRITNCGYAGKGGYGIYVSAKNYLTKWNENYYTKPRGGHVVQYNTVKYCSSAVFGVGSASFGYPEGHYQSVFIPLNVSYNEFSNGGLAGVDIGVAYFWGAVMGRTDKPTRFHHNIVYIDTKPVNRIQSIIYHDNFINCMETYKNITYYTNKDYQPNNNLDKNGGKNLEIYVQNNPKYYADAYAEVNVHDNKTLGVYTGTVDTLSDENYPDSLKFKAGIRN